MADYHATDYARWAKVFFNWDIIPEEIIVHPGDINWEAQERFLPQRKLELDRSTQMSPPDIFIPILASGAIVFRIEGTPGLATPNGQHRLKAAELAGEAVRASYWGYISPKQGGAIFAMMNGDGIRAATGIDRAVAQFFSGYPEDRAIANVLARFGLRLPSGKNDRHTQRTGVVLCSITLRKVYRIDHGALLHQTLTTIVNTWGNEPKILQAHVLEGVTLFMGYCANILSNKDRQDLYRRLRGNGFEAIDQIAHHAFRTSPRGQGGGGSLALYFMITMRDVYNRNRKERHRVGNEKTPYEMARSWSLDDLTTSYRAQHIMGALSDNLSPESPLPEAYEAPAPMTPPNGEVPTTQPPEEIQALLDQEIAYAFAGDLDQILFQVFSTSEQYKDQEWPPYPHDPPYTPEEVAAHFNLTHKEMGEIIDLYNSHLKGQNGAEHEQEEETQDQRSHTGVTPNQLHS